MLFRKLVLLGGACTLLLVYHGGYWLSDWPWLFYYALVFWWFSFSWYIFITPKVPVVPGFAPIFPDTCYHLTHYWPAAADIPVASDNPAHYAD
ncbi:hypothetical protein, partial [Klebsiella pneumoniae]